MVRFDEQLLSAHQWGWTQPPAPNLGFCHLAGGAGPVLGGLLEANVQGLSESGTETLGRPAWSLQKEVQLLESNSYPA